MVPDDAFNHRRERNGMLFCRFHDACGKDDCVQALEVRLELLPLASSLTGEDEDPDKCSIFARGEVVSCAPDGDKFLIREHPFSRWRGFNALPAYHRLSATG